MNEYFHSIQGFFDVYTNYINNYMNRSDKDKNHFIMIQTAGEYYEMFQKELQKSGSNEFLKKASEMLLSFQDLVMEHKTEELKVLHTEFEKFISVESNKVRQQELIAGIFQADIKQMKLQNEKIDKCQKLINLEIQMYGNVTDTTKYILDVQHLEIVNNQVKEIVAEYPVKDATDNFYKISELNDFVTKYKEMKALISL